MAAMPENGSRLFYFTSLKASAMAEKPLPSGNKAPVPVEVANEEPLQVEMTQPEALPKEMVTKGKGTTLAPTTTEADDKVTEGQRHINLLWESVQGIISIAITVSVIYCQIQDIQSETLNNAFFFVVATYLQRTNHVRTGGIGPKASDEVVYRGR